MAVIKLTKDEVMKYVTDCWDVSDRHWEKYEKAQWDQSYQLYNNQQDWSDKEDWQAKCFIPKTEGNVDTTVNLIRRAFEAIKNWIQASGVEKTDYEIAPHVQKVAMVWATVIKLLDTVLDAFRTSLIVSIGITKTHKWEGVKWEWLGGEYQPVEAWKPIVEEIDPYDVRFSRDMQLVEGKPQGTYIIEQKDEEYNALLLKAEAMGYDVEEVKSEDYPRKKQDQKQARDQEIEDASGIRNPVEIKEFHGYVRIHPDKVKENAHSKGETFYRFDENLKYVITYANDKTLMRVSGQSDEAYSYPRKSQEYVYQIIRPFKKNFKFYGKSLVQSLARLQIMLNDIWNMDFDNLNWVINKLFYLDTNKIDDADDLAVEPGALIRGSGPANEAFQNILVGDLPQSSVEIPKVIEYMMDRHSGNTPQVQGISQPGTESATEFAGLMQQSTLKFETMGKILQGQVKSILEAFIEVILETDNEYAWEVTRDIIGEQKSLEMMIAQMMNMSGQFKIEVTAISEYINKIQTANKLLALLNILGPLVPQLGINIRPIVKGILRANEDILDDINEVFPDVPTFDINTIMQVLGQIDPSLPQLFMATLQRMAPGGGGGEGAGLRSEAQPGKAGLPETMLSPQGWAAGGGPQG